MKTLLRWFLVGVLLAPTSVWAAVAHDGEANLAGQIAGASSSTLTGKTTAGSNRVGVCSIGYYNGFYGISSVTWNGVAMTLAKNDHKVTGYEMEAAVYYIVNPPTGASNIVATFGSSIYGNWGCASFTGVDQVTPIGNTNNAEADASAGPATVNVTSSTGNMVVDATAQASDSSMTVGAGQTAYANNWDGVVGILGGGSYETGSGTVTMSWTWSGTHDWAIAAAELVAAGGGGGGGGSPNFFQRRIQQ